MAGKIFCFFQNYWKKKLKKGDIKNILFLCENGFEDIIIPAYKTAKDNKITYDILTDDIETEEMIDTILKYPSMLKYPIIFDDKKILIGYNSEDIRMFLPREYKRLQMSNIK